MTYTLLIRLPVPLDGTDAIRNNRPQGHLPTSTMATSARNSGGWIPALPGIPPNPPIGSA